MNNSPLKNYYNNYWANQEGWGPRTVISQLQQRIFAQLTTPASTILDLGCGDGMHYGRVIAQTVQAYYGLDISQVAVDSARQSGILAQQHDLSSSLPYPDEMFDIVICFEVLEHLIDPSFTLKEIKRVIKPSGRLVLSVPNIVHFPNRVRTLLGGFSPGGTPETSSRRQWADPHIRFFTLRSLHAFIAEQHMQIEQFYGEGVSLLSTFPILSPLAARIFGWKKLEEWSQPFEFLANIWPSFFAGHFIVIASPAKQ